MMKQRISIFLLFTILLSANGYAQKAIMRLTQQTLMHEVRETPSPLDGQHITVNPPRFMWPDKFPHLGAVLDGVEEEDYKPEVTYRIRIARDPEFKSEVITAERKWAFFNPFKLFEKGKWYWQYAYVDKDGKEEWSPVSHFYIDGHIRTFSPPSLQEVLAKLPKTHPRILLDAKDWDNIIERNKNNPEAQAYIRKANKCLNHPLKHLEEEIDTTQVVKLTNIVQYRSALIRESRKIVDREEANIEAMVRAYLLTKNEVYYKEGIERLSEILSWKNSKYFAGDFNRSTILSMSTSAYDAWYNLLTPDEKKLLLRTIRENGKKFYHEYVNHLENRIADNHVWQMTFRILNMAAFATYGELPMASTWVDYCYNEWVSRLPGLNTDGGWHNGDSYFQVNLRTLIEVPAFYSRISGFDFFADPWYNNNAFYVIYQQPPFSKSAGQGNSHESKMKPNGTRVGYADALARECNNPWAAAYVRTILQKEPDIMEKTFLGKSGDLTWYRCITKKALPKEGPTLAELPMAKVFNETGIGTMNTSLGDIDKNAMLSFRSSSYGSTSHALANQNAFNTFFGGRPLFYSSGHHISFTDEHSVYCHRSTRAHNSILINGMGQRIGTEGYGWIPRYYTGKRISYFVGDASNAYGEVVSPLWLARGRDSGLEYSPANGWDRNRLKTFRRHIVELGNAGLVFIYDELEADTAVTWSYLLHTIEHPMIIKNDKGMTHITATNVGGVSDAYLFANDKLETKQTDQFFYPAVNWLRADDKGDFAPYKNHWHFTATSPHSPVYRFATIVSTHEQGSVGVVPEKISKDTLKAGGWIIKMNISPKGKATFTIENKAENIVLEYDGSTKITEEGQTVTLKDQVPELEI